MKNVKIKKDIHRALSLDKIDKNKSIEKILDKILRKYYKLNKIK